MVTGKAKYASRQQQLPQPGVVQKSASNVLITHISDSSPALVKAMAIFYSSLASSYAMNFTGAAWL